ncbi:PREDICTED: zinc finger protein 513 [Corvus brachyrhynchos]|uniref:zinc finger protein 513 n=1 Tax=Corvus brachyrhynchos TaxID=85066 RepID=UPI0008167420|nr:PREDICTED: zinc finger protein 513 [Corvus brachyrhynchos]
MPFSDVCISGSACGRGLEAGAAAPSHSTGQPRLCACLGAGPNQSSSSKGTVQAASQDGGLLLSLTGPRAAADTLVGKIAIPAYALSDDDCSSGYQQLSVESDPEEGGEPGPAALPYTGEKPYRCTCCSFACSSLGNLKRHERVHSQDKPFQCAACDYRCNQSRNLKRHMLSHRLPEGEGPHRRDKDPEPLLPELSLHVGSGSGPFLPGCARLRGEEAAALPELLFPFTCRMCGLVLDDGFAQDEGLAEQVCGRCSLAVLGTEPGASPRKGAGDKGFACSLCPFVTHYPNHLARHMKTHSGEKPFACPLCPYASAHLDNLKRHQRVHTGEKPYKCQLCDYACGNLANLKRHGRIHSGDKPFQCSLCSYSCNQSMNLKRHMLRHTGEKPFQCRNCSYTTGHWDNYKRHQKIHGHTAESWVNPRNAKALLAPPAVGTALP